MQHGLYQTGFPIKTESVVQLNHRPSFFLSLLPQEGICLLAHGQLLFGHPPPSIFGATMLLLPGDNLVLVPLLCQLV